MKKLALLLTLVMLGGALAGCGKNAEEVAAPETEVTTETETEDVTEDTTEDVTEEEAATEGETEADAAEDTEAAEGENTEADTEGEAATGEGYADNFEVDSEAAAAFAEEIKAVVADKDLEGLADLMGFPNWIGFADGGSMVETREDFIALGADKIFTEAMVAAMEAAPTDNLSPSMAGFSLTKDGKPNIVFGVWDGELRVSGMNY